MKQVFVRVAYNWITEIGQDRYTAKSVKDEVLKLVMDLLDQTGHSVGEICEPLGYDNQNYFIETSKTHVGVTPVEYRE